MQGMMMHYIKRRFSSEEYKNEIEIESKSKLLFIIDTQNIDW